MSNLYTINYDTQTKTSSCYRCGYTTDEGNHRRMECPQCKHLELMATQTELMTNQAEVRQRAAAPPSGPGVLGFLFGGKKNSRQDDDNEDDDDGEYVVNKFGMSVRRKALAPEAPVRTVYQAPAQPTPYAPPAPPAPTPLMRVAPPVQESQNSENELAAMRTANAGLQTEIAVLEEKLEMFRFVTARVSTQLAEHMLGQEKFLGIKDPLAYEEPEPRMAIAVQARRQLMCLMVALHPLATKEGRNRRLSDQDMGYVNSVVGWIDEVLIPEWNRIAKIHALGRVQPEYRNNSSAYELLESRSLAMVDEIVAHWHLGGSKAGYLGAMFDCGDRLRVAAKSANEILEQDGL